MTGKRSYSSVCNSPGTAWFAYACSSTASVSNFAASRKNAGYRARATSSFISCNTPRAPSSSSAWSMNFGPGIRRPCS
ncbi:hypothetical protein RKD30_005891 [Streptomyces pristinaespiralis]